MQRRAAPTAARQALETAIERGLIRRYGGHWAVRSRQRIRIYQHRHIQPLIDRNEIAIDGDRLVRK